MKSDNQHIDDFFRNKEQAFIPDPSHHTKHWQQLKAMRAIQLLKDFYARLEKEKQVFTVNTDQPTVLVAKEGTRLHIPADCFSNKNGIIQGQVQITLQEFYKYPDMIAARLATTSDNRQLITGGMLYLEANANGEALEIASGKIIHIRMPAPEYDERMILFSGIWQEDRSQINWIPVGQQHSPGIQLQQTANIQDTKPAAEMKSAIEIISVNKKTIQKIQQRLRSLNITKLHEMQQDGNKQQPASEQSSGIDWNNTPYLEALKWASGFIAFKKMPKSIYRFNIKSLGWINCDRYYDMPKTTVPVTVNVGEGFDAPVFSQMVFIRKPSIVYGEQTGGIIRFNNIPANEPVSIIITGVKEGKVVCCMKAMINSSPEESNNLTFHSMSPEQYKQILDIHFPQNSRNIEPPPGTQPGAYC